MEQHTRIVTMAIIAVMTTKDVGKKLTFTTFLKASLEGRERKRSKCISKEAFRPVSL